MKKILSGIAALATSLSSVKLENYFKTQNVDAFISLVIAVICALLVYFAVNYILLHLPLRIKFLRKYFLPASRLEGYWYEQVDKKTNPYSYACIEYEPNSDQFLYYGKNYDTSLNIHATFRSVNVQVKQVENRIYYYFDAQMHSEGKDQVSGYGCFTFYKDGGSNYNRGDGYIIDSCSSDIRKIQMVLSRMEKKDIKSVIGKTKIENDNDIYKLVESYSQRIEFNRFNNNTNNGD